ncbi:MAG: hypothetical protein AAF918_00325 [Pseudomonadota bacterium]
MAASMDIPTETPIAPAHHICTEDKPTWHELSTELPSFPRGKPRD